MKFYFNVCHTARSLVTLPPLLLLLSSLARISLSGVSSGRVAGEALSAESGVAVIEEHGGVAGTLDGRHLGGLRTFPGGAVWQSVTLIPGLGEAEGGQSYHQQDWH